MLSVTPAAPTPPKPITVNPPKSMGPSGPLSVGPTAGATQPAAGMVSGSGPLPTPGAPPLPKPTAPVVAAPGKPPVALPPAPPTTPPPAPGFKPLTGTPPKPGTPLTANATAPSVSPAPSVGGQSSGTTPPAPAAGGAAGAKSAPVFAPPKRSFMSFLPFIGIGVVVLAVLGWVAFTFFGAPKTTPISKEPSLQTEQKPGTTSQQNGTTPQRQVVPGTSTKITYWGLWEPSSVLTEVFKEYEQANPGVTIEYVQQSYKDYRERLQTAVAGGTGPDVFRFHASWTPMLKNELAPVPASVFSVNEYKETFYPVALQQLQVNNQIVGVPLMYDGLALYYNKSIFQTAGAKPPTTWAELRTLAQQLTVRSGDQIQRGGLAIGNASNVEHYPEILGLLMLQNGAELDNPTSNEAKDALTFYTNFIRQDKVWDSRLPNSTVAFARGEAAMMFAPSWRAHEIKALNPNLDFAIVQVPRLASTQLTWATYWAEGVNSKGKNKDASWKLIKYMASKDVQQRLYAEQSKVRSFGEIYSRKDLANQTTNDPYVAAYLSDAPTAQGWYLNSFTHDNGINDQMIKYYTDAINTSLDQGVEDKVLQTLDLGTQQVLRQYGVTPSTGSR
jgi:multiple sugar transport system substrate-binding protein